MSERIALIHSHGVTEDIPDSTWSNINPDTLICLALRHVPAHLELHKNIGIRGLASLVQPTLSNELTARLKDAPVVN